MPGDLRRQPADEGPGKPSREVWYQNAAFVWIPLMVIGADPRLDDAEVGADQGQHPQQFDIFSNQDTWWMTLLYIMTFGTFSGLSAQFGLLMTNLYGSGNADIVQGSGATAQVLVAGYAVPDAVKYVFLGPLVGAGARVPSRR
jgi:NNP family nitrate/nitrite transporter-like MFS transporter